MPSIGIACIFTIIRLDNPNLQKMKPPTRLSLKKSSFVCPFKYWNVLAGKERGRDRGQRLWKNYFNFLNNIFIVKFYKHPCRFHINPLYRIYRTFFVITFNWGDYTTSYPIQINLIPFV